MRLSEQVTKNNKTKLLIVDDSSNNRAAISYWLGEDDYEILHAVDGPSALKIVEMFVPDIILLDYNLPGIDGIEVCQRIRAMDNLPFVPIVMMSSHAPEAQVIALEQGADEFIIMPIQATELKSRLRAMLRLKEAVSRSLELTKQNKKLQELDKIKSNFISKVSHELKTPLQAILGYTDILRQGLQGELNYPQRLMTKQIKDAGEQLLSMINQLLDFESIEKGTLQVMAEVFDIENVFDYLQQVMAPYALKKKIGLNFVLENKGIQLQSDRNLLQKALLNIISNSIKFSKEGGKVYITARDVLDGVIEFKVKDEGVGIAKSNIAYIFEKFWQVDDSITRNYGGIGIGLALAKKIITKLGGGINVESKPNAGSTFIIHIPKEYKEHESIIPKDKLLQKAI
ncbi:MAG: hybrid sensor histidine kinase/response regulator [Candidatus Melainabacteria bacterium]|nr:hybrid sensor histidine kinase/response regulator [Candidatus Melainabacteria bacterium]MBI3308415.1 hybrid sensor histidine kinase/response regulator [Candidatus Melainabacteria bacterium]